jgi:outer membrane protein OmpA-like peptidoglycan-associated protein
MIPRATIALAAALVLVLVLGAGPALAETEPDAEGCKDSRVVPRYPGQSISECRHMDFDAVEVPLAVDQNGAPERTASPEGIADVIVYSGPANVSALQIARNYERALKSAGFDIRLRRRVDQNDGVEFVTAQLKKKGTEVWVAVKVEQDSATELKVVEVKALEQKVEVDAAGLLAQLEKTGRVAVYGILFDTGKATLRADSEPVLAEIQKLLEANPELKLRVEGHTDKVGKAAANLKLSKERAAAVRRWLVKNGVAEARLVAEGYGDAKPVAENDTEDGRAKNRRVELARL